MHPPAWGALIIMVYEIWGVLRPMTGQARRLIGSYYFRLIKHFTESRVPVDWKEQRGRVAVLRWGLGGGCAPAKSKAPPQINFLTFQVENAGFYAFLLQKTTCSQKPGRGVIDSWGSEDVICMGLKISRGFNSTKPPSSRTLVECTSVRTLWLRIVC